MGEFTTWPKSTIDAGLLTKLDLSDLDQEVTALAQQAGAQFKAELDARIAGAGGGGGGAYYIATDNGVPTDGTTECSAALTTAANAANAAGLPLFIPAGTYNIGGGRFSFPANTEVVGAGAEKTNFNAASGFSIGSEQKLRGFSIDFLATSYANFVDGATHSRLKDVRFKNADSLGTLHANDQSASNIVFNECGFTDNTLANGVGFVEKGGAGGHFEDIVFKWCYFENNHRMNFECIQRSNGVDPVVTGYRNVSLYHCYFDSPGTHQYHINVSYDSNRLGDDSDWSSGYSVVKDNIIIDGLLQLEMAGAKEMLVDGNLMLQSNDTEYNISGSQFAFDDPADNIIINNKMVGGLRTGCGGSGWIWKNNYIRNVDGLNFQHASNCEVVGNTIIGSGSRVIMFDNAHDCVARGNRFVGGTSYPVDYTSGTTNCLFDGNDFIMAPAAYGRIWQEAPGKIMFVRNRFKHDGDTEWSYPDANPTFTSLPADPEKFIGGIVTVTGAGAADDEMYVSVDTDSGAEWRKVLTKEEADTLYTGGAASTATGEMFDSLAMSMDNGDESVGIFVIGDGTCWNGNSAFKGLMDWIIDNYPNYTTRSWTWDNNNNRYWEPLVVWNAGTERAMQMGSGKSRRMQGGNVAGDLEVIVRLNSPTYIHTSHQIIAAKRGGVDVSWSIELGNDGTIRFRYSQDGTSSGMGYVPSSTTHGLVDDTEYFIRVRFTPDDGGGNNVTEFHYSTDRFTWAQIGNTVTNSGTVSIWQGDNSYEVGAHSYISTPCVPGTLFYELWVNDGFGGGPVVPPLVHTWPTGDGANASTTVGDPEVNILVLSKDGVNLGEDYEVDGWLNDATRIARGVFDVNTQVAFFNMGHDQDDFVGKDFMQKYEAWMESVLARLPMAHAVVCTSNPKEAGGVVDTSMPGHSIRRGQMATVAHRNHHYVIDSWGAIQAAIDGGATVTDIIVGDYPTDAGYDLWEALITDEFAAAKSRASGN